MTNRQSPALFKVPNEIFIEVASLLCTSDLRRLGWVNCRLRSFVADYLSRYRYNFGILTLPNELIFEIVQHLGHQKDRSRLARASQRFYPPVMRYIVRHNVVHSGSSLLNYAAKRNLVGFARKIISLGGEVNTQRGSQTTTTGTRLTPLATAALNGSIRMIELLLEFGASHFVDGLRLPLALAIVKKHESVALMLSRDLDSSNTLLTRSTTQTPLQMACAAQLVSLVRYYLEHKPCSSQNYDSALFGVIHKDASGTQSVRRKLYDEVFQIVLMLLEHGASPDIVVRTEISVIVTARDIALRHPDPRVRNIFPRLTQAGRTVESSQPIGRPWMACVNTSLEFQKSAAEVDFSEENRYVTIWDILQGSIEEAPSETEEGETFLSSAPNLAYLMNSKPHRVREITEPAVPPPLLSYPQLSIVEASKQQADELFWAKLPSIASSESSTPRSRETGNISQSSRYTKKAAVTESFPQLAPPRFGNDENRKEIWAGFRTKKDLPSVNNDERTSSGEDGIERSVRKKSKKKWEPLLL